MSMSPLFSLSQDSCGKVVLNTAYISLIGHKSANLLQHLCNSLEHGCDVKVVDGQVWYRQSMANTQYHTGMSRSALRVAREFLLREGLISIRYDSSGDRTTYWSVNSEKLYRLWQFSMAYRSSKNPSAVGAVRNIWPKWKKENPEIVEEFQHLCVDRGLNQESVPMPVSVPTTQAQPTVVPSPKKEEECSQEENNYLPEDEYTEFGVRRTPEEMERIRRWRSLSPEERRKRREESIERTRILAKKWEAQSEVREAAKKAGKVLSEAEIRERANRLVKDGIFSGALSFKDVKDPEPKAPPAPEQEVVSNEKRVTILRCVDRDGKTRVFLDDESESDPNKKNPGKECVWSEQQDVVYYDWSRLSEEWYEDYADPFDGIIRKYFDDQFEFLDIDPDKNENLRVRLYGEEKDEDTQEEQEELSDEEQQQAQWEAYQKQLAAEYKAERREAEKRKAEKDIPNKGPDIKKYLFQKKPTETSATPRRCKYVDYWNTLDHVPKCRYGTKAYAFARRFFAAHRRYQAGEVKDFMLTEDVRERIHLDRVNKIPPNPLVAGVDKYPIRSDEEMKRHIRQAALAYDPKYAPFDKKFLGTLPNFLYRDGRYSRTGTLSLFLEKVDRAPFVLEDASYDTLLDNASDLELKFVGAIRDLYYLANNRDRRSDLDLRELKTALFVARQIIAAYDDMPIRNSGTLIHHFPTHKRFLDWWKAYCEDHVWEGMPISALGTTKNMWRGFLNYVAADMGYDLITGKRCN